MTPRARSKARKPRRQPHAFGITVAPATAGRPLYVQVYAQLREHIVAGALEPGAQLPSARLLARDLQVSRNTIEAAFDQLVAEGFVDRRVGSGSRVSTSLNEHAPFAGHTQPSSSRRGKAPRAQHALSERGQLVAALGQAELDTDATPGVCAPDVHQFPRHTWQRALARQARHLRDTILTSAPAEGWWPLREQIAAYASLARGLRCTPDQVVIVASTQQAVDLVARVLLDPGDEAIMEDPGYPSVRAALLTAGARVHGVRVDGEGLDVDCLPATAGRRVVYVTPSHQFPTGVAMSLRRRLRLLQWAADTGAWILEDDYDSEFRYDGRPLAALRALDRHDRVIYIATCNKMLFPGLRLAYVILPPTLIDAVSAARRLADGGSPPLMRAALAEFMATGQFAAYLRHARHAYHLKRDLVVSRISTRWPARVRLGPTDAGLHVVAHLPAGIDDRALAAGSADNGMSVAPLSRYFSGAYTTPGLVVSFGASASTVLSAALDHLGRRVAKVVS